MEDHLSTKHVSWILGRSAGTVRDMVKTGEIDASRITTGFRIPKAEVLRLARQKVESEGGRQISDRALEGLIDEIIATNEAV
jgi:excisionase family DNA binding protein